mmetsp:Transcript_11385/g.33956  ORF Transcript_11385/g.33956 Transcript_11385/m.33956 type:complete len:314 (+) Transcript_11385:126-1067(+)
MRSCVAPRWRPQPSAEATRDPSSRALTRTVNYSSRAAFARRSLGIPTSYFFPAAGHHEAPHRPRRRRQRVRLQDGAREDRRQGAGDQGGPRGHRASREPDGGLLGPPEHRRQQRRARRQRGDHRVVPPGGDQTRPRGDGGLRRVRGAGERRALGDEDDARRRRLAERDAAGAVGRAAASVQVADHRLRGAPRDLQRVGAAALHGGRPAGQVPELREGVRGRHRLPAPGALRSVRSVQPQQADARAEGQGPHHGDQQRPCGHARHLRLHGGVQGARLGAGPRLHPALRRQLHDPLRGPVHARRLDGSRVKTFAP